MAYKTLLFGVDDIFNELKPYYEQAIQRGVLEVVTVAVIDNDTIKFVAPDSKTLTDFDVDIAIISSHRNFYSRMKQLETYGVPRDRIIDGRVFKVPNLDFPRLLAEGIAYGTVEGKAFVAASYTIYPQNYKFNNVSIKFGRKSYIGRTDINNAVAEISVGNFSPLSWSIAFDFGQNADHNYQNVSSYSLTWLEWETPKEFYPPKGVCKVLIGNDVWCGHGVTFKSNNPAKPLVIGDGAVIASDSVVVKSIPPYAIVGGNPAQIIKYRFEPHIIDALLRIKWWDWSLDKIHDNFKYFNDVKKFIALHDK